VSPATLVVVTSGERFPIEGSVTIGRSDCDIVLDNDQVSRRHATVWTTEAGIEVEDLGSRNGTRVNSAEIQSRHPLEEGDIVEIGNVELRVEGAAQAPPPPTTTPPTPAQPPQFKAGTVERRSGPSAARRSGATLIALGTIAGTAVALVAYFVDRGL
jgi:pSer/pThr/pTyr-binding forkhead associated (FHA) protein